MLATKQASGRETVSYDLIYHWRETMPDRLEHRASKLGITPEQLIRRFVSEGMRGYEQATGPSQPTKTLNDYLVNAGALKSSR